MKPLSFPLLADESIATAVVEALCQQGKDVRSLADEGLVGASDIDILREATKQRRVVLTHDSDFGRLVFLDGEPFAGIIYLRPGHIDSSVVLEMIAAIAESNLDAPSPFVVVAERRGETVRIRVRGMP